MKDILSFIVSIPWYVWGLFLWIYCVHVWRTAKTMTPEEMREFQEKNRRKTLGLD